MVNQPLLGKTAHEARVFIDGMSTQQDMNHQYQEYIKEVKKGYMVGLFNIELEEWLDEWMEKKELEQAVCELFSDEA